MQPNYKKAPKLYKIQQNYTKYNQTIQNTTKLYKIQQNNTKYNQTWINKERHNLKEIKRKPKLQKITIKNTTKPYKI